MSHGYFCLMSFFLYPCVLKKKFVAKNIKIVLKTGTIIVDGLGKNVYNYCIDWDIRESMGMKSINMDGNNLDILMEQGITNLRR